LAAIDELPAPDHNALLALGAETGKIDDQPFAPAIADFYLSNAIARSSAIMAEMSVLKQSDGQGATGTDG